MTKKRKFGLCALIRVSYTKTMKTHFGLFAFLLITITSCAHNETNSLQRAPSSAVADENSMYQAQWENDVCVLKGESREQDYVIRFSEVHHLCPQLRDYNPAGVAYTKLKNSGRGVHIPACKAQKNNRAPASKCWMGFDVFGQSLGSCTLMKTQSPCTSCQCNGKSGVAWQQ